MKRDPSIHIKLSDLARILTQIEYNQRTTGTNLADKILEASQPYQITGRYSQLLKLNKVTKSKIERSSDSDNVPLGFVEKVNLFIYTERTRKYPNAKVKTIDKENRNYLQLKEVTKMAYDFAEDFDIQPRIEGVKEFITIGMNFMTKYGLNRFKSYRNRIHEYFESNVKVLTDEHKEDTQELYSEWQGAIMHYVGIEELTLIDKEVEKYVHIVYAREQADSVKADYADWVNAQFEGLAFLNAVPNIYQFHGQGALDRYTRYITNSVDVKPSEDNNILDNY